MCPVPDSGKALGPGLASGFCAVLCGCAFVGTWFVEPLMNTDAMQMVFWRV